MFLVLELKSIFERTDDLARLLADLHSDTNTAVIAAAKALLELGEYGQPAGIYLLRGGKVALGVGHLADAVVLLHHGLRVAEPNTKVWAELLVNRASACAHHGFCRDAITAGEQFLGALDKLPQGTRRYIPSPITQSASPMTGSRSTSKQQPIFASP